jgi:hypothetical protein
MMRDEGEYLYEYKKQEGGRSYMSGSDEDKDRPQDAERNLRTLSAKRKTHIALLTFLARAVG